MFKQKIELVPISTLFTVTVTVTKLFEGSLRSVMEVSAWSRRSSLFLLDLVGESAWGRTLPRTPSSSSLPPSSSSSGEWRASCWMMISTGILLQKITQTFIEGLRSLRPTWNLTQKTLRTVSLSYLNPIMSTSNMLIVNSQVEEEGGQPLISQCGVDILLFTSGSCKVENLSA